jgi:arylsulfatase A-like enzyme
MRRAGQLVTTCAALGLLAAAALQPGRGGGTAGAAPGAGGAGGAGRQPHIVLVIADDLGYNDLGSFNGENATATPRSPFLDSLMRAGVKLKQFYATPQCSPTRGTLLTGRYPHRWGGQSGVAVMACETFVNAGEVFLSERLQAVGYYTAYIGKWHLG